MQNRQNGRRRRGGGNNPRPMGQPMGGQGNASRLEVRVRGNAHQLLEKYKVMARDAHQAGDRVAAEYYLQHADHYFRVLNDSRIRQDEMRARRGAFDSLDDEPDQDEDGGDAIGNEPEARTERQQDRRDRGNERGRDRERPDRDYNDRERGRDAQPPRRERSGEAEADRGWRARGEPVNSDAPGEPPMSDGEAALAAFGGAAAEPAAAPRRRGRPRKAAVETGEASGDMESMPVADV